MWIICGGKNSKTLADMCKERTGIQVQGAEIEDVLLTARRKGKEYFKDVKGFIVLDAGMPSLMDIQPLNDLADLGSEVHFMNRYSNITNILLLHDTIKVHNVDELYVKHIQTIIFKGGK